MFSSLQMLAFFFPHTLIVETAAYIALFTFSAVLFISIFTILSLIISALISQSSVVLLVLLTVWVLAVNFPHLAGIITERISEIPGERTIVQRLRSTREEYDNRLNENFFNGKSLTFQGGFRTKEIALEAAKPLMLEAQKALWEIKEEYRNAVQNRQRFTRSIASLSPVGLFRSLAEQITGSGMESEERFMHDVQAFSQTYDRYIEEKLGEVVVKTEDNIRTRYWIWYTKNDGAGSVSLPDPKEYEGNKADFPRFEPNKNTVTEVLYNSFLSLSGLFLWNLVLAGSAFLAFNSADVR